MSESEVDNNKNAIIESETVNSEIESQEEAEPIVVKKGSFMGFLTFIFSVTALGLSGYMYYVQYYHYQPTTTVDQSDFWMKALSDAKKNSQLETDKLNQQLASLRSNNLELIGKIKTIEESASSNQTSSVEFFDDSELKQQIVDLQHKISSQNQIVQELQNKLNASNTQNSLSLEKLSADIQSTINNQSTNVPVVSEASQTKAIAGSLLQEAYIQLNINGNKIKAQDLLKQTISQLAELTGLRYGRLANELETVNQQLANIEQPDIELLQSQIKQLSKATSKLEFVHGQATQKQNQDSSWFDNLITIKKIDKNQPSKLSKSEQITIGNVISNHYQMLQMALISRNQELWLSEIVQIQKLLSSHFADNANDIKQQLTELASIELKPKLPNLEPHLQQFKSINLANENE